MKPIFIKTVFVFELILVLLTSILIGSSVLDDISKSNLITEYGVLDYKSHETIYFLDKEEKLLIHGFTAGLVDYNKLNQLQQGDSILYTHRKIRRGSQVLNYWTKKIEPLALSSKNGSILKYKDYLAERNSTFRFILTLVFGIPLLLIALLIIYSWCLALLLYFSPVKYANLATHLFVQHKVFVKDLP